MNNTISSISSIVLNADVRRAKLGEMFTENLAVAKKGILDYVVESMSDDVFAAYAKSVDTMIDRVRVRLIDIYLVEFTSEEIDFMISVNDTPVGRSMNLKISAMSNKLMAFVAEEGETMAREIIKERQEEQKPVYMN